MTLPAYASRRGGSACWRTVRGAALAAALALGACASSPVLEDFTTDGCSLFPDGGCLATGGWAECCVRHDRAYWRGGTAAERRAADVALRECVANTGRPMLAGLMHASVRVGGMPLWPTWFRWGYGWSYGRGYEPLTDAEQRQVEARLAAAGGPEHACAGE